MARVVTKKPETSTTLLEAAKKLVDEKKWADKSEACGQAPTLVAALGAVGLHAEGGNFLSGEGQGSDHGQRGGLFGNHGAVALFHDLQIEVTTATERGHMDTMLHQLRSALEDYRTTFGKDTEDVYVYQPIPLVEALPTDFAASAWKRRWATVSSCSSPSAAGSASWTSS